MPLYAGQVVAAKLRLVRPLGAGGMGSVWVADHLTLKTQVAVKFMSDGLAGNVEALARFSREAAAAARIKSPHVVKVFDFGVWERTPYMVLELLEGEDLATRIQRRGGLDLRETAVIVEQAARALEQAHASGVVHRDIKPANVFVTQSGPDLFVRLLDFGVARADGLDFSLKTETGAALGTPLYMAPEQLFRRGEIDGRTDLWSLAVVAYECLTGTPPFLGQTLAALGVAIHDGTFRPVSATGNAAVPMLDAFFTRAFARDVGARFQSARELADAFQAAAGISSPRLSFVSIHGPVSAYSQTAALEPTLHPLTMGEAPKPPPQAFTSAAQSRGAPARGAQLAAVVGVLLLVTGGIAAYPLAGFLRRPANGDSPPASAQAATAAVTATVEVASGPVPTVEPAPPAVETATAAPPPAASSAPKVVVVPHPTATATVVPSGPKSRRRDHGF